MVESVGWVSASDSQNLWSNNACKVCVWRLHRGPELGLMYKMLLYFWSHSFKHLQCRMCRCDMTSLTCEHMLHTSPGLPVPAFSQAFHKVLTTASAITRFVLVIPEVWIYHLSTCGKQLRFAAGKLCQSMCVWIGCWRCKNKEWALWETILWELCCADFKALRQSAVLCCQSITLLHVITWQNLHLVLLLAK